MLFAHYSKPPRPPESLGVTLAPAVRALLDKALAKQKEDRFQNAREMADTIASTLGLGSLPLSQPPSSPAVIPVAPLADTPRPSRSLPSAVAGVLVVALAAVLLWPAAPAPIVTPAETTTPVAAFTLVVRSLDVALTTETSGTLTDEGHLLHVTANASGTAATVLHVEGSPLTLQLAATTENGRTTLALTTEPPAPLRIDDILQGREATLVLETKPRLVSLRAAGLDRPVRFAVSVRAP